MRTVALVTEFADTMLDPGKRQRLAALRLHFASAHMSVTEVVLNEDQSPSPLRRVRKACDWRSIKKKLLQIQPDVVCVAGLGGTHLLPMAASVGKNFEVIFDSCDSWILQARARRSAGVSGWYSLLGAALVLMLNNVSTYSYISERDVQADRSILKPNTSVKVIENCADASLADLSPVHYPLARLVLPADLNSFHNRTFIEDASSTISDLYLEGRLPEIEVSGPNESKDFLPPGFRNIGWLEDISDVYRGDTGVLISNFGGSGVPNKLLEAIQARRPILLHTSLSHLKDEIPADYPAYWWNSVEDLRREALSMVYGEGRR